MEKLQDSALIIVDVQNDFCPGGALAVADGDKVVSVINQLMPLFSSVVTTQDWHPANHVSFIEQGGIWQPHCVQQTPGAELHAALDRNSVDDYFRKAFTPDADAYSGFEGVNAAGDSLDAALRQRGVKTIYVTGLATDYCVRATALDGLKNGYQVFVIRDAVRAVDVQPGDGERALAELVAQGAQLTTGDELLRQSKAASR